MYNEKNDDDDNNNNEETKKLKKIRRILLLKTDDELKKNTKKKSNIMINSKTIEEINKSYNIYNNILLSEKSKIYINFIKTEEKIYPNNIAPVHTFRKNIAQIKNQNTMKLMTSIIYEEESNSPILNYFPKKIDLGVKRLHNNHDLLKKNTLKERKFTEEKFNSENKNLYDPAVNKSTKIETKKIFKLVDKIVSVKMNEDIEETIKKNIIKLRKYCKKLKKVKKDIKKPNKIKGDSSPRKIKEKKSKGKNNNENNKRMTITNSKNFLKKSLFGSVDKNIDDKLKRGEHRGNTTKNIRLRNMAEVYKREKEKEKEKEREKEREKEKEKEKEREKKIKINRVDSLKVFKKIITNKKDKMTERSGNRKKFRRMQTLNGNFNKFLENPKIKTIKFSKKSEINKNDESIAFNNIMVNAHLSSSKFERPSFLFIYNNINNNNTIINTNNLNSKDQQKSKPISLFSNISNNNNNNNNNNKITSTKEKKGNNQSNFNKDRLQINRISLKKKKKGIGKIYERKIHYSRKDDNIQLMKLGEKSGLNEHELEEMNFLSDFNRKTKKKQIDSPA